MVKARSRAAARKVRDKWRAKTWYKVLAPPLFDRKPIAETLADDPEKLVDRVTDISMQDLTDDFRKSHIKLFFKINRVEGTDAYTRFDGHILTSDYIRRLVRRRRSRIDGVYDVTTKDGASLRVKPFATTNKRIQASQKRAIRKSMKDTISKEAQKKTLNEFIKGILDEELGKTIYQNCKDVYPVRRAEIYRTEILNPPKTAEEEPPVKPKKEKKPAEKSEETKEEKTTEKTEESTEEKEEEKSSEEQEKEEQEKKTEKTKDETKKETTKSKETKKEKKTSSSSSKKKKTKKSSSKTKSKSKSKKSTGKTKKSS